MATVSDMINTPAPIVLGGVVRKLRRLSVAEVFGQMEQDILEEYAEQMQKVAGTLSGKDKVDYLVQMSQGVPTGSALAGKAAERMGSLRGLAKLFKMSLLVEADKDGRPLPDPDLLSLVNENPDLVRQLSKAMVGIEATMVKLEGGKEDPLSGITPSKQ